MVKKIAVLSMLIISILALKADVVKADDVVVRVALDNILATYKTTQTGATFTPVRVTLSIENLSDRIQFINWKEKYHFWLYKVSAPVPGVDLGPIAAEGDLTAAHGIYGSPGPIEPHSVVQVAYGVLPEAITVINTYKGYLLRGTYVLRVEIPTGLPGSSSYSATETILFIK